MTGATNQSIAQPKHCFTAVCRKTVAASPPFFLVGGLGKEWSPKTSATKNVLNIGGFPNSINTRFYKKHIDIQHRAQHVHYNDLCTTHLAIYFLGGVCVLQWPQGLALCGY